MPSSFLLSSPVFDTAYSPPLVLLSHEGLILLLLTQVLGKILNTKRTEIKNSSVQENQFKHKYSSILYQDRSKAFKMLPGEVCKRKEMFSAPDIKELTWGVR